MPGDARQAVRQALLWGANVTGVWGGTICQPSLCPLHPLGQGWAQKPASLCPPESLWQQAQTLLRLKVSRRLSTPLTACSKPRRQPKGGGEAQSLEYISRWGGEGAEAQRMPLIWWLMYPWSLSHHKKVQKVTYLYVNHLVEQDCAFDVPHKSLAIMKRLLSLAMVLSFRPL